MGRSPGHTLSKRSMRVTLCISSEHEIRTPRLSVYDRPAKPLVPTRLRARICAALERACQGPFRRGWPPPQPFLEERGTRGDHVGLFAERGGRSGGRQGAGRRAQPRPFGPRPRSSRGGHRRRSPLPHPHRARRRTERGRARPGAGTDGGRGQGAPLWSRGRASPSGSPHHPRPVLRGR